MSSEKLTTAELLERLIPSSTETAELLKRVHHELVSLNGVHRVGALPRPIVNGASIRLSASAGQLAGYAIRETAGAVATVRLRDGLDASGDLIIPINLAANQSVDRWLLPHGIAFINGLFVEVVAGSIEGTVFVGPTGS